MIYGKRFKRKPFNTKGFKKRHLDKTVVKENKVCICPICKLKLSIHCSQTVREIIQTRVWGIEDCGCIAEPRILAEEERAITAGISLEKEYHRMVCYNCGFIHEGIKNASQFV